MTYVSENVRIVLIWCHCCQSKKQIQGCIETNVSKCHSVCTPCNIMWKHSRETT